MSRKTQIVGRGIDTLKVNVKILGEDGEPLHNQQLSENFLAQLQAWQEEALAKKQPVKTSLTHHESRLVMYPNGASSWRYIMRNDCLEVKLVPRLKLQMVAKVTLQSGYLWKGGAIQTILEEVQVFLDEMCGKETFLQVAQIDLCADVVNLAIPADWQKVMITHALKKHPILQSQIDQEYYYGRKLETVIVSGHGKPVNAKFYDKVAEIKKEHEKKAWFYDMWKERGWDGESSVCRYEFSVEREALHEMDLEEVSDVIDNVKRLWFYCTQEWLRMVKEGASKNRTRWETRSGWQTLQGAFDDYSGSGVDELGPLVREQKRQVNMEQLIAQIAGMLTTYGAWETKELDQENCADELFSLVHDRVVKRWEELEVNIPEVIRAKKFMYHQKP